MVDSSDELIAIVSIVSISTPPKKKMTTNYLQGPIRAVDVLDALVWEDSTARDRAANAGRHSTDAHYLAWKWLTAVVLEGPRPELPWHAQQALKRVQLSSMHRLESDR